MFDIQNGIRIHGLTWLVYEMVSRLVEAGWTVPSSSDGTTYNPAGNVIANGILISAFSPTPGSPCNANSWFRLRHPLGSFELCFHHGTANHSDQWKIRYSTLGFTGGAPSATASPTAADEVYVIGASATNGTLVYGHTSLHVAHFIIGDADEDYAWAMVSHEIASPDIHTNLWFCDRVSDVEVVGDDPSVIGFSSNSGQLIGGDSWTPASTFQRVHAFMSKYGSRETEMRTHSPGIIPASVFNTDEGGILLYGANPYSGLVNVSVDKLSWIRRTVGTTAPASVETPRRSPRKGTSRLFSAPLSSLGMMSRTISYGGSAYYVVRMGSQARDASILVPWAVGRRAEW